MILQDKFCKKCGKMVYGWCKPCQIDNLRGNFTNWTSENEKIDNFIQEMQLKIRSQHDVVFEWIPYNRFDNIEEISKGDFATIYSAIWQNGPLYYNKDKSEYTRKSDKKVLLRCLQNLQNLTNEFLNEVWNFYLI